MFGHKFANYMPEKVQTKPTVVIKSKEKCTWGMVEKIAYIENHVYKGCNKAKKVMSSVKKGILGVSFLV